MTIKDPLIVRDATNGRPVSGATFCGNSSGEVLALDRSEAALVQAAARKRGQSMTAFARSAVNAAALAEFESPRTIAAARSPTMEELERLTERMTKMRKALESIAAAVGESAEGIGVKADPMDLAKRIIQKCTRNHEELVELREAVNGADSEEVEKAIAASRSYRQRTAALPDVTRKMIEWSGS